MGKCANGKRPGCNPGVGTSRPGSNPGLPTNAPEWRNGIRNGLKIRNMRVRIPSPVLMICWDAITMNCDGGPEGPVMYRHERSRILIVGEQPCITDDPISGMCPVYLVNNFIQVQYDSNPCLLDEPPLPWLGEILLMKVTVLDPAENEDC